MTRAKRAIILILAGVGFAASFFALSIIYARITASYWRQQLDAAPDDGVEIVIRRIADLDTAGIPILVEALGAERECVALAAKQELFVQLEEWRMLSAVEYASRMAELIDALAERVDRFNPAAQRDAGDLASGVLIRLSRNEGFDANKLLAASEKVLRAGINAKGESKRIKAINISTPALLAADDSAKAGDMGLSESSDPSEQSVGGLTPLIVDGLPGKSLSAPEQSNEKDSEEVDSLANQPWLLGKQAAARQRASRIPDNAETSGPDEQSADSGGVHRMSHVAADGIDRQLSSSIAGEDVVELMKELNSESDTRAIAVEAELVRRGFAAVQIDLARRLFDHDPAVRKRLVQEVPGLQGVDAVPWLLQLCRDTDAEVRLAAITFLATSSDPSVLDEVEQIGQRDTDSGVRRIADRITQQHNTQR